VVADELLPRGVVVEETRDDHLDIALFAEEEAVLGKALGKRRREFISGRACARRALVRLGFAPVAIPSGRRGEPSWPIGVVGSITHCEGYRACAVGRASDIVAIGIDAELNEALPDSVLTDIAASEELLCIRRLARREPCVAWDRLLFSAKESVYKVWYPLARRWLGFDDAIVTVDPVGRLFTARLLVPGPAVPGGLLSLLVGRWAVRDGLVLTAIALPRRGTVADS
jgi:4'-phosphopantetheinyl transferase EntD